MLIPHSRPCILVVDDEFLIRIFAVDLLEDHGFRTLEACDGLEALALLQDHPEVELLLTDINMPGEPDGLGLAHEARANRPDIDIVVTSGRVVPGSGDMPLRSRFVGKPYTCDQLLNAVQRAGKRAAQ